MRFPANVADERSYQIVTGRNQEDTNEAVDRRPEESDSHIHSFGSYADPGVDDQQIIGMQCVFGSPERWQKAVPL